MDKKAYNKWVARHLNEDSDWETVMCEAETKATASFFGRTDKRKAIDVIATPMKKIKIENDGFKNRSKHICSNGNLNSSVISSSMENLFIGNDVSYNLRKRGNDDDISVGSLKKQKFN